MLKSLITGFLALLTTSLGMRHNAVAVGFLVPLFILVPILRLGKATYQQPSTQ
jgi:hypothetical protein